MAGLNIYQAERLVSDSYREPEKWRRTLDLVAYEQIEPSSLQYLASNWSGGFAHFGLTHLDAFSATIIAKIDAHICFTELVELTPEVASILASECSGLIIDGKISCLSLDVAMQLAKTTGLLSICLHEISVDVAKALITHRNELSVSIASAPSKYVLHTFSRHAGYYLCLEFPDSDGIDVRKLAGDLELFNIRHFEKEGTLWAQVVFRRPI